MFGAALIAGVHIYILDEHAKMSWKFQVQSGQTPPPHKTGRTSHSSDGGDIYVASSDKHEHIHKCSGGSWREL